MDHPTASLTSIVQILLNQLQVVLHKLDDDSYGSSMEILSNSSLGGHVRHTLEFFDCWLQGVNTLQINYDERKRDHRLETERQYAIQKIKQLIGSFQAVSADENAILITQINPTEDTAHSFNSSTNRELWYTIEHAIHHFAIIKIGIIHFFPQFQFPDNFGVASSTVSYQLSRA